MEKRRPTRVELLARVVLSDLALRAGYGMGFYSGEVGVQARWNNGFSSRITYAYTKEQLAKDKDGNTILLFFWLRLRNETENRYQATHQWADDVEEAEGQIY